MRRGLHGDQHRGQSSISPGLKEALRGYFLEEVRPKTKCMSGNVSSLENVQCNINIKLFLLHLSSDFLETWSLRPEHLERMRLLTQLLRTQHHSQQVSASDVFKFTSEEAFITCFYLCSPEDPMLLWHILTYMWHVNVYVCGMCGVCTYVVCI